MPDLSIVANLHVDDWIGRAANIAQVFSVLVPAILWKIMQCHVTWCWRHGTHPVEGTGHKLCDKHDRPAQHRKFQALRDARHKH